MQAGLEEPWKACKSPVCGSFIASVSVMAVAGRGDVLFQLLDGGMVA